MSQVRAFMTACVPFWRTLGFSRVSASEEGASLEGEYRRELARNDVPRGGVLAGSGSSPLRRVPLPTGRSGA